ncbi:MAG: hypothetical protein ABSF03_29500 [Streptosporangiaceae bacterium]
MELLQTGQGRAAGQEGEEEVLADLPVRFPVGGVAATPPRYVPQRIPPRPGPASRTDGPGRV